MAEEFSEVLGSTMYAWLTEFKFIRNSTDMSRRTRTEPRLSCAISMAHLWINKYKFLSYNKNSLEFDRQTFNTTLTCYAGMYTSELSLRNLWWNAQSCWWFSWHITWLSCQC